MALEDAKSQVDTAITRKGFRGLSHENTFGGVTSFLRRRYSKDLTDVDVAVTGVPFDQSVTNRPGTRLGPRAIREASCLQSPDAPYGWDVDPLSEFAIADYGDMAFDYAHVDQFPAALEAHIAGILDAGAASLVLGGDHYITFPILRAYAKRFGPLSVLHFDAHTDTWADDDFTRIDHGTMMYKAVKEGLVDPSRSIQVGIRTSNTDTLGFHIIDAPELHDLGPKAVAARIKDILADHPTYLTFDIDALDPAYAPGTGTPVWGGLTSAQAAAILHGVAGINVIGGDVVEVSPPFDTTGATAIAGAHVAPQILCLWAHRRKMGGSGLGAGKTGGARRRFAPARAGAADRVRCALAAAQPVRREAVADHQNALVCTHQHHPVGIAFAFARADRVEKRCRHATHLCRIGELTGVLDSIQHSAPHRDGAAIHTDIAAVPAGGEVVIGAVHAVIRARHGNASGDQKAQPGHYCSHLLTP